MEIHHAIHEHAAHAGGFVKKHWPLLLGGVVGIVVLMKMTGAGSSSSSSGLTPAQVAAMASGSLAAQQMNANATQAANTLTAQSSIAHERNQVAFLAAQGAVAAQVGDAAAQMISTLQMPTIAAINDSAAADTVALKAATGVATASYGVQDNAMRASLESQRAFGSTIAQTGGAKFAADAAKANAQAHTDAANAAAGAQSDSAMWSTIGMAAMMLL